MLQAGILTPSVKHRPPIFMGSDVLMSGIPGGYSGGTVPGSHRVPWT